MDIKKLNKQLSNVLNEEMYTDEKDVPPLHDYAIIFKYQEPWPDGKLAYRAIMKLTTGSSYRMQSWSYTKEGMINIVKKQWPYADIVDKTNEPVSESYNEENVEKLETLEDLKNYFDTGLETIDCEITYFPYEPTQKVLRITSASPKINREWLKEVSNGKIKLVGVRQHKNRFGAWIKMYDHFYGYVDNMNERCKMNIKQLNKKLKQIVEEMAGNSSFGAMVNGVPVEGQSVKFGKKKKKKKHEDYITGRELQDWNWQQRQAALYDQIGSPKQVFAAGKGEDIPLEFEDAINILLYGHDEDDKREYQELLYLFKDTGRMKEFINYANAKGLKDLNPKVIGKQEESLNIVNQEIEDIVKGLLQEDFHEDYERITNLLAKQLDRMNFEYANTDV